MAPKGQQIKCVSVIIPGGIETRVPMTHGRPPSRVSVIIPGGIETLRTGVLMALEKPVRDHPWRD